VSITIIVLFRNAFYRSRDRRQRRRLMDALGVIAHVQNAPPGSPSARTGEQGDIESGEVSMHSPLPTLVMQPDGRTVNFAVKADDPSSVEGQGEHNKEQLSVGSEGGDRHHGGGDSGAAPRSSATSAVPYDRWQRQSATSGSAPALVTVVLEQEEGEEEAEEENK